MKIKDWIIIAGGLLFSWLFYDREPGINVSAFSLFIIIVLAAFNPRAVQKTSWRLAAGGLLLSAGCMAVYSNPLCFFATFFSMFLLGGITGRPDAPPFVNFVQSGISFMLAIPGTVKGWQLSHARQQNAQKTTLRWPVYIIIVAVFLLFLLLYSRASNAFSALLGNINFEFFSFGWLVLAVVGMILITALVRHRRIRLIDRLEAKWGHPLTVVISTVGLQGKENQLSAEAKTGRLLLILLNLLLLVVNTADILFLAGGMEGLYHDYSMMVHQGIGSLILSIIIAVIIILYFFRGDLNFEKAARPLYFLALLWIAQNLLLAGTAATKNTLYIDITGALTFKRIGVYYYLLLCGIGLFFTAFKLYAKKPNWYLVRVNFVAFFTVLVLSCTIPWSLVITKYNITQAARQNKTPDIYYLMDMEDNLPRLAQWALDNKNNPRVMADYPTGEYDAVCFRLGQRARDFINRYEKQSWQSFNYADYTTYSYLKSIDLDAVESSVTTPQINQEN